MREELLQILDSYEDFELAFLWKYKLSSYLEDTQSAILKYMQAKRGLSTMELESLIAEYADKAFDDEMERCPRCRSAKITAINEEYWNTSDRSELLLPDRVSGRDRNVKKLVCAVCDYVIQDLNNDIGPWYQFKRRLLAKLFRKS
jgi:hypothetical protein